MNVSNFKKDGEKISFDIKGVDIKLLNAFRRTIMSSIQVYAIEEIVYATNTSILNDENLSHRIGLVPLTMKPGKNRTDSTVTLKLEIEGPGTVYTKDLVSEDEAVKPVYDNMPLVKLMLKQKIKFEAKAMLGTGKNHMKWQPGLCSYDDKGNGSFSVFVESYGQLPVEELVKAGFEVMEDKLGEVKGKLK
jgi:DNA-directed RNA polymerase subunit D